MQNCYSNRYICTIIVALYMIILFLFFSLLSLALSDSLSLPLFNIKKKETTKINPKLNTPDSNTTTTANLLQHQFNPNTINPKLMKNHHKPNLKSTQNKTPKNLFGKIQINPKPKPLLPWNACRRHERESVREIFFSDLKRPPV